MNQNIPSKNADQERKASLIAIVLLFAILANLILSLSLGFQTGAWQQFARAGFVLAFGVITIIALVQIKQGHEEKGIWSIIGGLLFSLIGTALFLAGLGLILGLIELVLVGVVASIALPKEKRTQAIIVTIIAAGLTFGLDFLPLDYRIPSPTVMKGLLPVMAVIVVAVMGFNIVRRSWARSMRNKLIIILTTTTLLLVGSISGIGIYNSQQEVLDDEFLALHQLNVDYNDDVSLLEDAAALLSISLSEREDIKELYLEDDRNGLLELLTPFFEGLRDEYDIRHLYIENPDGTVYVRVHNPESFGDDVTYRLTAATALNTKETVTGVEIGPNRIGIRSVSPLYQNNSFIGLIEVGLDYDETFIKEFKAHTGADYTMWVSYEAAAPAGLKPTENAPEAPISDLFFYASTTAQIYPISSDVYKKVLESGESVVEHITIAEEELSVLVAPMHGYGNRTIGIIEIAQSRTEALSQIQDDIRTELFVASIIMLIGLFILWLASQILILRPLGILTVAAQRQAEGDLSARVAISSKDEMELLGNSFNEMTSRLQNTQESLEQRVADRTRALATAAEVGRRLSSVTNPRQLVAEVVEQVQRAFNYYYAQIYLLDDESQNLVLAGGTGTAGAAMLARGHRVPKGRGLVGRAADTNASVLVPDVSQEEGWLPNEMLPETKTEIAVPIAVGNQVMGVLDVQHSVVNGLTDADVTLLESLASQAAISIQNARTLERSRKQAETESLVNVIGQRIQKAATIEETLQIAIRELGIAIGASSVKAKLNPATGGSDTTANLHAEQTVTEAKNVGEQPIESDQILDS